MFNKTGSLVFYIRHYPLFSNHEEDSLSPSANLYRSIRMSVFVERKCAENVQRPLSEWKNSQHWKIQCRWKGRQYLEILLRRRNTSGREHLPQRLLQREGISLPHQWKIAGGRVFQIRCGRQRAAHLQRERN